MRFCSPRSTRGAGLASGASAAPSVNDRVATRRRLRLRRATRHGCARRFQDRGRVVERADARRFGCRRPLARAGRRPLDTLVPDGRVERRQRGRQAPLRRWPKRPDGQVDTDTLKLNATADAIELHAAPLTGTAGSLPALTFRDRRGSHPMAGTPKLARRRGAEIAVPERTQRIARRAGNMAAAATRGAVRRASRW